MRALVASIALGLGLVVVLAAQDPPPIFRGGVDVVHVDVSVLDRDRKPVRGLTAADFTVIEDGRPRPIVAFSSVELPARIAASADTAPWLAETPLDVATNAVATEGRLVTIVFDWSIRFADQPTARRIAREAVNQLGPGDLGAVVFTHGFSNGGTTHNFTADKARLLDAIDRPMTPAAVEANGELRDVIDPRGAPPVLSPGVPDFPSCECGYCSWEKVGEVADAVSSLSSRRKTLLFIATYGRPPFMSRGCGQAPQVRDVMARKLALANLTVHVVDPSGLEALELDMDSGSGGRDSLRNASFGRHKTLPFLADLTNGRVVINRNDPEAAVPAVLDETSSYYVLAFPAAERPRARDGFNRIEVKVNRPGVVVQARSAYQAGQSAAALEAAARKLPLVRAIESTLARTDVALSLTALPFATPGLDTAAVAVVLRTQPSADDRGPATVAPTTTPAPRSDHIDVVVAAVDPQGKIVASTKHVVDIPWMPGTNRPGEYELLSRLELKPGRYEIRAAADITAGPRSSVYGFVEVPKFAEEPLSLSGVALHVSPARTSGPKGALGTLLPIVPTARREFRPSDLVTAFVRVYRANAPESPVTITARILDSTGRVAFEERQQADVEYHLELPTERLTPGEHLLDITATSGNLRASRRVRFTLR